MYIARNTKNFWCKNLKNDYISYLFFYANQNLLLSNQIVMHKIYLLQNLSSFYAINSVLNVHLTWKRQWSLKAIFDILLFVLLDIRYIVCDKQRVKLCKEALFTNFEVKKKKGMYNNSFYN